LATDNGSDFVEVMVSLTYLVGLPDYPAYEKIGWTSQHPDNHYGTLYSVQRIQTICDIYNQETAGIVGVNDMSLPEGGRFDLGPSYSGSWWNPPHSSHMLGTNADIPYSWLSNRPRFEQIAREEGANPLAEGNHYHLRF
jgi:murein endopeptidase